MRFKCKTHFDISATGVTGHFKSSRVPFTDRTNQHIEDEYSWNRSRNQQRNWETITQLIGMRTQINFLEDPVKVGNVWEFEFEVDAPAVFGTHENPVALLLSDADGVPMLVGLGERKNTAPMLITAGNKQNTWFTNLT